MEVFGIGVNKQYIDFDKNNTTDNNSQDGYNQHDIHYGYNDKNNEDTNNKGLAWKQWSNDNNEDN